MLAPGSNETRERKIEKGIQAFRDYKKQAFLGSY